MELKDTAYRMVTELAHFNVNASYKINSNLSLKDTIDYVFSYINNGGKGSSYHASIYLMKLLYILGLESELILTLADISLEDGSKRKDLRASVLLNDGNKYIVMNPVEDIEFFERKCVPTKLRINYYKNDSTILKGEKSGVFSIDAASIELSDFIKRYGNGLAWTLGSLYRPDYDKVTFGEIFKKSKIIDLNDYISKNTKIKS